MTLAMHGKSHRRRGLLALAAFFAVFGAILAGAAGRPSGEAKAIAIPLQSIILCKEFATNGPADDLGRTFTLTLEYDDNLDDPQPPYSKDYVFPVDEGDELCTKPQDIPSNVHVTVSETLPQGFVSKGGYPVISLYMNGQWEPLSTGLSRSFEQDDSCLEPDPCVVRFTNKHADEEGQETPTELQSPFRICKSYESTGPADQTGVEFSFEVEADYPPLDGNVDDVFNTSITLDEGAHGCTDVLGVPPGTNLTVTEGFPAWWYSAPGYPKHQYEGGPVVENDNSAEVTLDTECSPICTLTFTNREYSTVEGGYESLQVCKTFEATGPIDVFGVEFKFSIYVDEFPYGNADYIIDLKLTLDEGETTCSEVYEVPAVAILGAHEILPANWQSEAGYPYVDIFTSGQWQNPVQDVIAFFDNDHSCGEEPCVMHFHNKAEGDDSEGGNHPVRVCKTFLDNQDGTLGGPVAFEFNANGVPFSITVAEGGHECTIVWVALESLNQPIFIAEQQPQAPWNNAPGFPKVELDDNALDDNDYGQNAWSIIVMVNDGCYPGTPPVGEIPAGVFLMARQALTVVLPDEPLCTVQFYNMEVPGGDPVCEGWCGEPVCEFNCEPQCEVDCDEPQCEVNCDSTPETTPTPPSTPVPSTPTPEPEEETEGEKTPGPQVTPLPPSTGNGLGVANGEASLATMFGIAFIIAAAVTAGAALAPRR